VLALGDRDRARQVADGALVVEPRAPLLLAVTIQVDGASADEEVVAGEPDHPLDEVGVGALRRRARARLIGRMADATGVLGGAGALRVALVGGFLRLGVGVRPTLVGARLGRLALGRRSLGLRRLSRGRLGVLRRGLLRLRVRRSDLAGGRGDLLAERLLLLA